MARIRQRPRISPGIMQVFYLAYLPSCAAKISDTFDRFFPNYGDGFQTILRDNCSSSYKQYLQQPDDVKVAIGGYTGFGDVGSANIVVNCILGATPEIIKAKMASAQIILGLAPSLLASVGIRPQDTAIVAVIGRKPLLAGLLAAGSPAVFAHRASEYALAISELREPGLRHLPLRSHAVKALIDAFIYVVAGASAANIALLAWELSDKVPFAMSPDNGYLPFLWVYLGFIIHILAAVTLSLSVTVEVATIEDTEESQGQQQHQTQAESVQDMKLRSRALFHLTRSLDFGELGHRSCSRVLILPSSLTFYTLSWITSVFTTCHIVFGTILFASALFISIDDSLVVIARFLASAIICRVLLKTEIILLGRQIHVSRKEVEQ